VNIDKYIGELLYGHDCVIVPDFGGFVANYSPARIHPTQHTFTPPFKNIVFNKNLKGNDGLLANAIATAESISFAEATRRIAAYVESCLGALKGGKRFAIENVGTLYFDVEHNLQFEPDGAVNYLLESFGLTTFQSPAIKRGSYQEHYEKQFVDRDPIPAKRRINIGKYVALAVAGAAVVFAAVWIPLKTDLLSNANYSALNPFAPKEKGKYVPYKAPVTIDTTDFSNETEDHGTGIYSLDLTGDGNTIAVASSENAVAAVDTTSVATSVQVSTTVAYHVVGGCFSIYENAERYVAQLRAQNIDAAIIGRNGAGLNVVSLGDYANREEAMAALNAARAGNPDAWLLKQEMSN
jgi:hypothetical protein